MQTYAEWALDAHVNVQRMGDNCRGDASLLGREKLVLLAEQGLKLAAYLEGTEAFQALCKEAGK